MKHDKGIQFLAAVGLFMAVFTWTCGQTAEAVSPSGSPEQRELLEVKVHRLIVDPTSQQPVVILTDSYEERALLIWISSFEASAIYRELQGIKPVRPQTHDLLESIIQKVNGKVHHIVIPRVEENIYYATIVLQKADVFLEIDARPSDSIVMALKFKAPIFVSNSLFAEMAIPLGEQQGIEELYGLSLQNLTQELAKAFSFKSTSGVLVSNVRKGSQAEQDGVERGDIIVQVGGQAVDDVMILRDILAKSEQVVDAKIYRKTRFLTITFHLK
jgi:bifunctional DNase/RNase